LAFLFLMLTRAPQSTLFPYTTLFRSEGGGHAEGGGVGDEGGDPGGDGRGQDEPPEHGRRRHDGAEAVGGVAQVGGRCLPGLAEGDRKSTRLNSSHDQISYAVFCLKKK